MNTAIIDIHTHNIDSEKSIISLSPQSFNPLPSHYYSVGIHPWKSNDIAPRDIELLHIAASHPQVVAIGETGIDRLRGASLEKQIELFIQHIELSEKSRKPLILHVVKATDVILNLHNNYKPTQQWIIHGFRGNEKTAQQLLSKGIELSFGKNFNPLSVAYTPLEKLWIETDESNCDIENIYNNIAQIKGIPTQELLQSVATRAAKLFFRVE